MLYEEIIFFILHDRKREKKLVECFMASPGVSFKDVFSEINFKIGFFGLILSLCLNIGVCTEISYGHPH